MKIALHWKIIIGMVTGALLALGLTSFEWGGAFIADWIKPWGTIFINTLKLIAVPLILASLIKGVSDLKDTSSLSKMGGMTIGLYLMTTILAVSIGLVIANVIQPGNFISESTRIELLQSFSGEAQSKIELAQQQQSTGPLQSLIDMVPTNLFAAASNNGNMLQVIFFALFFGIALILLPEEKTKTVKSFFDGLNDIVLKMIDLIMMVAPWGVMALVASLVAEAPNSDLLAALGIYSLTVILGLFLIVLYL